jgi:four helix bundle protein
MRSGVSGLCRTQSGYKLVGVALKIKYGRKRIDGMPDSEVYNFILSTAVEISQEIADILRTFPEEKCYFADLISKHSRLVCTHLQEAWHMKEQKKVYLDKLSEAARAASRTQDCLEFAMKYNYIDRDIFQRVDAKYEDIFDLLCTDSLY